MKNRRPLIAGNWKMYKTPDEAAETARQLVEGVADVTDVDIMIAPTYTALAPVFKVIQKFNQSQGNNMARRLVWCAKNGRYLFVCVSPIVAVPLAIKPPKGPSVLLAYQVNVAVATIEKPIHDRMVRWCRIDHKTDKYGRYKKDFNCHGSCISAVVSPP